MKPTPELAKVIVTRQEQVANHAMHTDGNSATLHCQPVMRNVSFIEEKETQDI